MIKRLFYPPFLKYPRDLKKIQEILLKYRRANPVPVHAVSPSVTLKPELFVPALPENGGGVLTVDRGISDGKPAARARTASPAASNAMSSKTASAAVELLISPAGHLALGAHCTKDVEGIVHSINQHPVGWFDFEFAPASSGPWSKAAFIGTTGNADSLGNIPFMITIDSDLYADIYGQGNKWFRVVFNEMNVHWGNSIVTMPMWSNPVLLDFSTISACNIIHAVRFHIGGQDVGTECTLTGSQNGSEPAFHVVLEKPALSDQTIRVSTDNANLGWILTNKVDNFINLVIPAGQQSGAISWFLGTKKVITTGKHFHVVATLVQPDGSYGNYGLGKVSLTKT